MKKIIATLLVFTLCIGLCACGGSNVEVPTRPVQAALPDQSVTEETGSGADAAEESAEAVDPTGETYPWEAEFREEDYVKFSITAPNGDEIVTWREGSIFGTERRNLYEWAESGTISDSYYYPSGNTSHEYTWYTDGAYVEANFLDNGYVDLEKGMTHMGTQVYYKRIEADGSWLEQFSDENGYPVRVISKSADGTYSETEYYENGNMSKSIVDDPVKGEYQEQEYFENGNMKYLKFQTPEYTAEERYDEEGFRTYYYTKGVDWEQECIADDTGKLVKVVENGTAIEDAATLARYASDCNFRE